MFINTDQLFPDFKWLWYLPLYYRVRPVLWISVSVPGWIWGPDCDPPPHPSFRATVCFYRQFQKRLLWPAVIPGHKSPTPPTTVVEDEATDLWYQTRHTVFIFLSSSSAATWPQSRQFSLFLERLVWCDTEEHSLDFFLQYRFDLSSIYLSISVTFSTYWKNYNNIFFLSHIKSLVVSLNSAYRENRKYSLFLFGLKVTF